MKKTVAILTQCGLRLVQMVCIERHYVKHYVEAITELWIFLPPFHFFLFPSLRLSLVGLNILKDERIAFKKVLASDHILLYLWLKYCLGHLQFMNKGVSAT